MDMNKIIFYFILAFFCFSLCSPPLSASIESSISNLGDAQKGFEAQIDLISIGTPAVEPLIRTLDSNDILVKRRAIIILGEIGDSRAIKPLLDVYAKDPDTRIKLDAEISLRKLGISTEDIIEGKNNEIEHDNDSSLPSSTTETPKQEPTVHKNESEDSGRFGALEYIIMLFFVLMFYLFCEYRSRGDSDFESSDGIEIEYPPRPQYPDISDGIEIEYPPRPQYPDISDGIEIEYPPRPQSNSVTGQRYIRIINRNDVPEHAKCVCRSYIKETLNEFGGTIKCPDCHVLAHEKCIKELYEGKCSKCKRRLL